MPEKSSADFCCCDGCQQRPDIWDRGRVTPYLTALDRASWKKYCCSCIPEYAYVTIIDSDGLSGGGIFRLWCNINSDFQLDQPLYTKVADGGILVGSTVIDVTFHIKIRDGQCLLYVVSNSLNADENTYGASKVINAESRAEPNNFCSTLSNEEQEDRPVGASPYTEFIVGGFKIRLSAADHVPIRGRDHCVNGDGQTVFDDDPIRDLCCNCDCICRCMCLSISSPGMLVSVEDQRPAYNTASIGCLYCGSYIFAEGVTARIGRLDGVSNGLSNSEAISCWSLDEETGARLDLFDLNNLIESTPISSGVGKLGNAAEFIGNGLLINDGNPTLSLNAKSASISTWVRPLSLYSNITILGKTDGNAVAGFGWKIWYNSVLSKFVFSISNGTTIYSVISPSTVTATTWHFIHASIDDELKVITIRVNNETIEEEIFSGSVPSTTAAFTIGGQDSISTPEYFNGFIDQTVIWKYEVNQGTSCSPSGAALSPITSSGDLWNEGLGKVCSLDERCYLIITSMGSLGIDPPAPILLDKIENPCPRPVAQWTMWRPPTAEISYERPMFMSLRCASEERCSVDISSCCSNGRTNFPSTLTADIQTGCYSCPTTSVTLVWDYSINTWKGSADMCGHLVELSIGCGFNSIGFSSPPCIIVPPNTELQRVGYSSCEPILAVFTGPLSGIGCCPGVTVGINEITITVYE